MARKTPIVPRARYTRSSLQLRPEQIHRADALTVLGEFESRSAAFRRWIDDGYALYLRRKEDSSEGAP